jgi:hypothetical protein
MQKRNPDVDREVYPDTVTAYRKVREAREHATKHSGTVLNRPLLKTTPNTSP